MLQYGTFLQIRNFSTYKNFSLHFCLVIFFNMPNQLYIMGQQSQFTNIYWLIILRCSNYNYVDKLISEYEDKQMRMLK